MSNRIKVTLPEDQKFKDKIINDLKLSGWSLVELVGKEATFELVEEQKHEIHPRTNLPILHD